MSPTVRPAISSAMAGWKRHQSLGHLAVVLISLLLSVGPSACSLPLGDRMHIDRAALPDEVPALIRLADRVSERTRSMRHLAKSVAGLEKAAQAAPNDPEVLWRLARGYVYIAEQVEDRDLALRMAAHARRAAKRAIALAPTHPEGYYFDAAASGLLARLQLAPGKSVQEAVEAPAQKLLELAPEYEAGGAMRILGALYVKAPTWPAGVGDADEGLVLLERAVREHPEHPLNHLFLAQAHAKMGRRHEAISELRKVLRFPAEGEWRLIGGPFRQEARQLLRDLKAY